jgi:hypothetical protein
MLLNKIFYSWLSLCSRKTLYKATIYSCYNEYKQCYYNVKNKDNNCDTYMDINKWEKLSHETKEYYHENSRKQTKIVKEMVDLVKIYCKKYPDEKICDHCNFQTYDEYPYRLPQTLPEFIKLL